MSKRKKTILSLLISGFLSAVFFVAPCRLGATVYGSICGKVVAGNSGMGDGQVLLYFLHPKYGLMDTPLYASMDANGNFCFDMLEEGIYYVTCELPEPHIGTDTLFCVKYLSKGRMAEWPDTVVLEKGQKVSIVITANLVGGSVSGRILQKDGTTAIPNASIMMLSSEGGGGARSDELGKYRCFRLLPGVDYTIVAELDGYGRQIRKGIHVEANQEVSGMDMAIDTHDPTGVEGVVLKADGQPAAAGFVSARNRADSLRGGICVIQSDGTYSISALDPGTYDLMAYSRDGGNRIVEGIYIQPGKKVLRSIVLSDTPQETSTCPPSPVQASTRFANQLDASSTNRYPISAESENPYASPIIQTYDDVSSEEVRSVLDAYDVAAAKINTNCGKWKEGDRDCIWAAAKKILSSSPNLSICRDTECKNPHGTGKSRTSSRDYHPRIVIYLPPAFILDIFENRIKKCELQNLVLHEMIHAGGLDKYGTENEARVEACTNLCFEDEKCHGTYYGSIPEDCNCKDKTKKPPSTDNPTPGNDCPDDNFSFASNEVEPALQASSNPEILVVRSGYWQNAGSLMNALKRAISYIKPDQSPLEMKNPPPVLVIPSGGLFGLENSLQFRSILYDYVSSGGTLIVFAQQHGYEYSLLPTPEGERIEAYGWREDQSCLNGSIYIGAWDPVLSSVTTSALSIPVDGYITQYPANSQVFLQRTRNGEVALVSWALGEGRVVASSLFTDWQGQTSDRRILRDLVTWAKNPGLKIPEFDLDKNPSPEVSLDLVLKNDSLAIAEKARVLWFDPDRNLQFQEEQAILVPSQGQATLHLSRQLASIPDARLGIWHMDYILYDNSGKEIQSQREADSGRFAVSRPPAAEYVPPNLSLNVTAPEYSIVGSEVTFQAHVTNASSQDKRIRLYRFWSIVNEWNYWDEAVVPAGETVTREITLVPPAGTRGFWLFAFEENGKENGIYKDEWWGYRVAKVFELFSEPWPFVNHANKGIRFVEPSTVIQVRTDQSNYRRGQAVSLNGVVKNSRSDAYDILLNLVVVDSKNQLLFQDYSQGRLEPNETLELSKVFSIPMNAIMGTCHVYMEALDLSLKKIGSATSIFEIPSSYCVGETVLPTVILPNATNRFSILLQNKGHLDIAQAEMEVRLLSPKQASLFQEKRSFGLAVGQSDTMDFDIPLADIEFGDYTFFYVVSHEFGVDRPVQTKIPSQVKLDATFDKNSYRVRDEWNLNLALENTGRFSTAAEIEVAIPGFQYSEKRALPLNPGEKAVLTFSSVIPTNIGSGLHEVQAVLTLASGSRIERQFQLSVPAPAIQTVFTPKSEYEAGAQVDFEIFNAGGIDAAVDCRMLLIDLKTGAALASGTNQVVIEAGKKIGQFIAIPSQAASSAVLLSIELTDAGGRKMKAYKSMNLSGLEAAVEVKTTKDIYLQTEPIRASSKMTNGSREIKDGNLSLKVVSREPAFEDVWKYYYNPFISGYSIGCDKNNHIWTGSSSHRISRFNGTSWSLPVNEIMHLSPVSYPTGLYYYVHSDREHNLWIFQGSSSSFMRDLWKFDGVGWEVYNSSNSGLVCDAIYDVETDLNGSHWFGTNKGAIKFDGTNWTTYDTSNSGLPANCVEAIAVDQAGNLWFGTDLSFNGAGKGASRFDGATWTNFDSSNSGIMGNKIRSLCVDQAGSIWFATNRGASKFTDGQWKNYNPTNSGIKANTLFDIEADGHGNVWLSYFDYSLKMVTRFDGVNWTTYDSSNSPISYMVWHLTVDQAGNLWCIAANYQGAAYKFDGAEWTKYDASNSNLPGDNEIKVIQEDAGGKIWIGSEIQGILTFDGMNWTNWNTSNSGLANNRVEDILQDRAGNWWFATYGGGVSRFDSAAWITYNTSNSGLASNNVNCIFQDESGDFWIGTNGSGVSRFNGTGWTTYNTSNSGLANNRVGSIVQDNLGNIWMGTFGSGASRYDGTNWTTFNATNSGLQNNQIQAMAKDGVGALWYGTWGGGLSRFDGTDWTTYTTQNSDIGGDYISCLRINAQGILWFGLQNRTATKFLYYGVGSFDGTNWTTYHKANSGLSVAYVYDAITDRQGSIWMGTSGEGLEILRKKGTSVDSAPLWETNVPVALAAGQVQETAHDIGTIGYAGKLFLVGSLSTSTGQVLSRSEVPFSVTQNDTILVFGPDKAVYKQGEAITVQGEVKNLSQADLVDAALHIQRLSAAAGSEPEEVYSETLSIPAGETRSFGFSLPASEEGSYALIGVLDQAGQEWARVYERYDVARAKIAAKITVPDVVGADPFEIVVELENRGGIEGRVTVEIQPGAIVQEITVPAGGKRLFTCSQQIFQSTSFWIHFGGDLVETVTRDVLFGLGAQVSVNAAAIYAEGRVEIPMAIANTGILENVVNVDFVLEKNGSPVAQTKKVQSLPAGQSVSDTLIFNLISGNYELSWSSAYGSGKASFQTRPLERMTMDASLGQQTDGGFPLNVSLTNLGGAVFSGSVAVESAVFASSQDVQLNPDSSSIVVFIVNPEGVADGKYDLAVRLLRENKTTIAEKISTVTVSKSRLDLTSIPEGTVVTSGGIALIPFTVKNWGTQEGRGSLQVEVLDGIYAQEFFLSAGEEKELNFSVTIPEYLPQANATGKYRLTQGGGQSPVQGEFRFLVQGVALDVGASLDRPSYREGENAVLTLAVTNQNQEAVELMARVNLGEFEETKEFNLQASASLMFQVPVHFADDEKAFYGIYHRDGRAIHLNTVYIYHSPETISVDTDKQVYNPGDVVTVSIQSQRPGLLKLEAPGCQLEVPIAGDASHSFSLPADLIAGTYSLLWEFAPDDQSGMRSGSRRFDLAGLKVVVAEASLAKAKYGPGETIDARIVFESNRDADAQMIIWVMDPGGAESIAVSKAISLSSASHTVVNESFGLSSTQAGMHQVLYALYGPNEALLVSGMEAFDCGDAVLLGVSTDRLEYPGGGEVVKVVYDYFGRGAATLQLFLDEVQVAERGLTLAGIGRGEVVLDGLQVNGGSHQVRAVLLSGALSSTKGCSFLYGTSLPDLQVNLVDQAVDGLNYTYKLGVINNGRTAVPASLFMFSVDGAPVTGANVGALEPGAFQEFDFAWSGTGKAGEHELLFTADDGNAVKEYSEANNEYTINLKVPALFYKLEVQPPIWAANMSATIYTRLINNQPDTATYQLHLTLTHNSSGQVVFQRDKTVNLNGFAHTVETDLFETGINPAGDYTVLQTLTSGDVSLSEEMLVIIETTQAVTGTVELVPSSIKANLDTAINVKMSLANAGNVALQDEPLVIDVINKDTQEKVKTDGAVFSLNLAEQKLIEKSLSLNMAAGTYLVQVKYLDKLVAEAELVAAEGLEKRKAISAKPRVLLLNALSLPYLEPKTHLKAILQAAGVEYRDNENILDSWVQSQRSEHTISVAFGNLLSPVLKAEIAERVFRGEGLILYWTGMSADQGLEDVAGVAMKTLPTPQQEKEITVLPGVLGEGGSFALLNKQKYWLEPNAADVKAVAETKNGEKPVMTYRPYGAGKVIAIAVSLDKASDQALAVRLLLCAVALLNKPEVFIISDLSRVIPVQFTLKNSTGESKTYVIKENIPQGVQASGYDPLPDEGEELKFTLDIPSGSEKGIFYWANLPDRIGTYDLKSEIYDGSVGANHDSPIDQVSLQFEVTSTTIARIDEVISELEQLSPSGSDNGRIHQAMSRLGDVRSRTGDDILSFYLDVFDLAMAGKALREVQALDVSSLRLKVAHVMQVYARRFYDKAMTLPSFSLAPFTLRLQQ